MDKEFDTDIITGLSEKEASRRLKEYGLNEIRHEEKVTKTGVFLKQFKDPLIIMLIIATVISLILGDITNAVIILIIILISSVLTTIQEFKSGNTMEKLLELVKIKTNVRRNSKNYEIAVEKVVPGDIINLTTGDIIPADGVVMDSKTLLVDESSLTGESIPVNKETGQKVFMGTYVYSGEAAMIIKSTGKNTKFGEIGKSVSKETKTQIEKDLESFGNMLMKLSFEIVAVILVLNLFTDKTVFDSIMFALAVAIGMTPQLLPAINTITLSYGAKKLSDKKVIVKKLNSIQNLGAMNILCTDKTGTITEGKLSIDGVFDIENNRSDDGLRLAYLNSKLQSGFKNPIDEAINKEAEKERIMLGYDKVFKIDEMPYNFDNKVLSIGVKLENKKILGKSEILITKGSVNEVIAKCSKIYINGEEKSIIEYKESIKERFKDYSFEGYRVIALAIRELNDVEKQNEKIQFEENNMTFVGFILMHDPLKVDSKETIDRIMQRGIDLKIITGDNRYIAKHIANNLELGNDTVLTGEEIDKLTDSEILEKSKHIHIFAEIDPRQKERIIEALKKGGNTVGYLGDGINDAPALKRADVSISVSEASDIAKEVADLVLMEPDLTVLYDGVMEGRKIFVNTMKYIYITTGENFGNMFSMSIASVGLPFIPLLPDQLMVTNLLTDIPQTQIASDNIDEEYINSPQKFDIHYIKRFMKTFGTSSAIFDITIFILMFYVLKTPDSIFRTVWFIESCTAEILSLFILRTRRPFYKAKPSKRLIGISLISIIITVVLPYTKFGNLLSLKQLPYDLLTLAIVIAMIDAIVKEVIKKSFYKRPENRV